MRMKWLTCVILVLFAGAFRLPAQQTKTEREFFEEAKSKAENGDASAQNDLGVCYYKGQGVAVDKIEAVKWYRRAAEQNDAKGQFNLAISYANGEGVAKDYVEAVKWFRKAAEQNIADAQYNLGICYAKGDGVTKDEVEAAKWFRKAAEQDYANAQCELGLVNYFGRGVEKDFAAAAMWYRKAAERGNAKAQYNLGHMYADGEGVKKSDAQALIWYHKAAEQGYADAQYNLGVIYSDGRGVLQDYPEAVKWLRKAADQGIANAQFNLGNRYVHGQGVKEDFAEAVKWYQKAADQGHASAQNNLRVMYENGKGVPTNQAPAFRSPDVKSGSSTSTRRALTQDELEELKAKGYDISAYRGEEIDIPQQNIPQQPAVKLSPTPDDLKQAIVCLNGFLGRKDAMIVADVISMKNQALKFRLGAQDFDFSGNYTVVLNTPRKHTSGFLGLSSPETAKTVILNDFRGKALPLPSPTIWEKSTGFIDVISGGKEWIYSGPYTIQK